MIEKYYLLSKDTGQGPNLIGLLERIDKDVYSFKYMIKGEKFPEWFMKIPGLDDINATYGTEDVKKNIIYRVTPRQGTELAVRLMKQNDVPVYDEWDLLRSQIAVHDKYKSDIFPLSDSHQIFYFYDKIPRKVNRYD
jgi:hypothetical protein